MFSTVEKMLQKMSTTKTKKCQPAAGDTLNRVFSPAGLENHSVAVSDSGLECPTKKTYKNKKSKNCIMMDGK